MNYHSKLAVTVLVQAALVHTSLHAYVFTEPFNAPAPGFQPAWQNAAGSSTVVSGVPGATGSSLKLNVSAPGADDARVIRPIPWNQNDKTAFIDFLIKPAANAPGSPAGVFVNGAQIAFQVPSGSATGEIWAYHGNDDDETGVREDWLKTPATYTVNTTGPSMGQATAFTRVTLRHDYQRNVWDLFVGGKMAAANLYFDGRGANLTSIEFYGSEVADLHVDELNVDPANMLFPDADKDGLPDAWETAHGTNPNLYDRDNINPVTGKSFLEDYHASLWTATVPNGKTGAVSSATIPPLTLLGSHQPVGALKGSLSVGGDGSSSYVVPIDIPKGVGGMEPQISLNYSSNGGNDVLGVGWSLGGLQRITRGPSSAVKDGNFDPTDFDSHDRFFLDGERLVCVTGTYGAENSEYRTEMDAFSRVTLRGSTPTTQWWSLETKAGLIVELGNTTDSRELASVPSPAVSPGVIAWAVNQVRDTVGNYYKVDYLIDSAAGFSSVDRRVNKIEYTGHTGGRTPGSSIEFVYEARPDQGRAYTRYAGYKATKRLSKVLVKTGTYVNHSYRLTYQNSYQSGRSFLTQIQKFANDNSSLGVPATTFHYDGLAEGQPLWVQRGGSAFLAYSNNLDATGNNNSSLITGTDGLSARLDGDVSRYYTLPSPVTVYSDTVMTFEFRGENIDSGAAIALDSNTSYSFNEAMCQIGGTTGSLGPFVFASQLKTYAPTVPGDWVTYSIPVGSYVTGVQSYLALLSKDTNEANGIAGAEFRNIRIYRSGTQVPADVSPVSFGADVGLPRFRTAASKDLGIRFVDLDNDGLPELCNWRAISYSTAAGVTTPTTVGQVYRNTGSGFVLDPSLRPPTSMPLSACETDLPASQYGKLHKVFASQMDINGDGRTDLLASTSMKYVGAALSNDLTFHTMVNGSWQELTAYKLPFRAKNVPSGAPHGGATRYHHYEWTDLDADGYQDLLVYTTAYGTLVSPDESTVILGANQSIAYLNKVHLGQGWVASTALGLPEQLRVEWPNEVNKGRQMVDLDGDGRQEIAEAVSGGYWEQRHTYQLTSAANGALTGWNSTPGAQNPPASPWDLPAVLSSNEYNIALANANGGDMASRIIDLNNDGLPDLVRSSNVATTNVHGVYLNRGAAFGPWVKELRTSGTAPIATQDATYDIPFPLTFLHNTSVYYPMGYELADLNADGMTDVLMGQNTANDNFNRAVLNTGNGWLDRPAWGLPDGARFYNNLDGMNDFRRAQLLDLNGDGLPDLITGVTGQTPKIWINQCKREVLSSVTDGFGNKLAVEYQRLNDPTPVPGGSAPVYTRYSGTLPTGHATVQDSRWLVSRLIEPDGLGGQMITRRYYGDLRMDRLNESSLGFGWSEVHKDLKTAAGAIVPRGYSRNEASQTYPYGGSPVKVDSFVHVGAADTRLPGVTTGYKLATRELSTYGQLASTAGVGGTVRRPVQTQSISERYDLDGTLVGRTTTVQNVSDYDAYGFVKQSTITALDGSAAVTTSTYRPVTSAWQLGRLLTSSVTKTAPGKTASTKSSSFDYDANGLIKEEIVEPGALQIKTAYVRDGSGSITQKTVTSAAGTRVSTTAYSANGRFADTETVTGLGGTSTAYDDAKGLVTSSTDIDGLVTTYQYDDFGTKIAVTNPDGTRSGEITRYANNGNLPGTVASQLGGQSIHWAKTTQSSGSPWATTYYDALGREIAKETSILVSFDGSSSTWRDVYAVTRHDARGRKAQVSQPFHAGEAPLWTTVTYDAVDRPLQTVYPDSTSDEVVFHSRDASVSTNPLIHSKVRNRNGQTLERWEDQHSRMVQSKDPSNQITTFNHNVEGSLLQVKIGGGHPAYE